MRKRTSTKWTTVVLGLALVALLGLVTPTLAEEKKDADQAKLVVGKWKLVKKEAEGGPPVGTVVEFNKDGSLKLTAKAQGREIEIKGKFKIEDGHLVVTFKNPEGKEQTEKNKIEKLDKKSFVFTDDGKKIVFERVKK